MVRQFKKLGNGDSLSKVLGVALHVIHCIIPRSP